MHDTALAASPAAAAPALNSALTAALFTAALAIFALFVFSPHILGDPDTYWHIATGQWILENRALPQADPFSHTFAGAPWIAKEWLSQVMYAAAYAAGGWFGVWALAALAIASAIFMITRALATETGPNFAFLLGLLALAIIATTLVARPHVLVFPIITAWTLALMAGAQSEKGPPWLALPLLTLWANMHAGFTVGLVITAFFGLEALLRSAPTARVRVLLQWGAFGAAALAAVLCTPYGLKPLELNASLAAGNEAMPFIREWRAMSFKPEYLPALLLAPLALLALRRDVRRNGARFLLAAFLAYLMIKHTRFVMAFGLVAPLIAGAALHGEFKATAARFLKGATGIGARLSRAFAPLSIGPLIATLALIALRPPAPPIDHFPESALAAAPEALRRENVYNTYDFGGFLVLNGIKTFIDGRTDQLFLGGFTKAVVSATTQSDWPAFCALLETHQVTWAIVRAGGAEANMFTAAGWKRLHQDVSAEVFVRTAPGCAVAR